MIKFLQEGAVTGYTKRVRLANYVSQIYGLRKVAKIGLYERKEIIVDPF